MARVATLSRDWKIWSYQLWRVPYQPALCTVNVADCTAHSGHLTRYDHTDFMPPGITTLGKAKPRETRKRKTPRAGVSRSSVLEKLRHFIEGNALKVGDALPPERVLAEQFGVGRPSVREGIKALTILDIIESRRGSGTYIRSLEGLRTEWPAKIELRSVNFNLLELLEVRKMLEPTAARLAATRGSEMNLGRIEKACSEIENDQNWDNMSQHDIELHTAIIEAAGNPVLSDMYKAMNGLLKKSRDITGHSAPDRQRMLHHHRQIVNAILRGESEAAAAAMLEHLHQVGLDLIANRKR
jgi:GntR family transcriptional regulator, transcriptional repressor for pyruvate dehydrogenase complex